MLIDLPFYETKIPVRLSPSGQTFLSSFRSQTQSDIKSNVNLSPCSALESSPSSLIKGPLYLKQFINKFNIFLHSIFLVSTTFYSVRCIDSYTLFLFPLTLSPPKHQERRFPSFYNLKITK